MPKLWTLINQRLLTRFYMLVFFRLTQSYRISQVFQPFVFNFQQSAILYRARYEVQLSPGGHVNARLSQFSFLVLPFPNYKTAIFLMVLSKLLSSMLITILSNLNAIRLLIYGNNLRWSLNVNLNFDTFWIGVGKDLFSLMLEKIWLVSFDHSNNSGAVNMDKSNLCEKPSFHVTALMFLHCLYSQNCL